MKIRLSVCLCLGLAFVSGCAQPGRVRPDPDGSASNSNAIETIRNEAVKLRPFATLPLSRRFLDATKHLAPVKSRKLYHNADKSRYYTESERQKLNETEKKDLIAITVDDQMYYLRYGTPLVYVRPLQILAEHGASDLKGKKILDFGYGHIGHLKLLAFLGAEVHGVDPSPILRVLYAAPGDQGPTREGGSVVIHHGRFPAEESLVDAIGEGYDFFISKNVLKRGYIYPARKTEPRKTIQLGVEGPQFVESVFRMLKPGGLAIVYNLYPRQAPPDKPYIPWADGETAFPRDMWEKAGFEVLVFDQDDTETILSMGRILGWDKGEEAMDLDKDLFAIFTVLRRPS